MATPDRVPFSSGTALRHAGTIGDHLSARTPNSQTELRQALPGASFHAFTATATPQVRTDIIEQLGLRNPRVLVGSFDRPNLTYRVVPRVERTQQVREVLGRHAREASIIYCLSRKDTDQLASALREGGFNAAAYHAGYSADERRRIQDAFTHEQVDIIVATVAFGMGIDRSDVRCVIHATMPKSLEHYQQETGRAGRDGLEAECVLLYSAADSLRWESLIRRSGEEGDAPPEALEAAMGQLETMKRYAGTPGCRHRQLTEYFGQPYPRTHCGACDICLDEAEGFMDGTVVAQKIISCVYRTGETFGIGHVVDVLRATFPPGSVTGAPKLAAMQARHHLRGRRLVASERSAAGGRVLVVTNGSFAEAKAARCRSPRRAALEKFG